MNDGRGGEGRGWPRAENADLANRSEHKHLDWG